VTTATLDRSMAKKKLPETQPEPATKAESDAPISVKLPADIVVTARVIAGIENIALADIIATAARENLLKWESEAMEKRARARGGRP